MSENLALVLEPQWEQIEVVRDRCHGFLLERNLHTDVIDAVTMVACELVENAVKYGSYGDATAKITVDVEVAASGLTVEVTNPVGKEDAANLTRLDRMIQWIRGYQDPFQAYLERLKEVSVQSMDSEESGLGLVRIAYEGQSIIDFYVNELDILAVSAVHQF